MLNSKRIAFLLVLGVVVIALFWRSRHAASSTVAAPVAKSATDAVDPGPSTDIRRNANRTATANSAPQSPSPPTDPDEIASPEECELACGSECVKANGKLRCPPRCSKDADCGSGQLCLFTRMLEDDAPPVLRCLGSTCAADGRPDQCGTGMSCRRSTHATAIVYRCEPSGQRKSGEGCAGEDGAPDGLCGPGLTCISGMCTPETCKGDGDCPQGSRCRPMAGPDSHYSCIPDCSRDEDCPADKRCVREPSGTGLCVDRSQPRTCLDDGCPDGETCEVLLPFVWNFQASCIKHCSSASDSATCGPGRFCASANPINPKAGPFQCAQACNENGPNTCPNGWICQGGPDGRSLCGPDLEGAENAYFNKFKKKSGRGQ